MRTIGMLAYSVFMGAALVVFLPVIGFAITGWAIGKKIVEMITKPAITPAVVHA